MTLIAECVRSGSPCPPPSRKPIAGPQCKGPYIITLGLAVDDNDEQRPFSKIVMFLFTGHRTNPNVSSHFKYGCLSQPPNLPSMPSLPYPISPSRRAFSELLSFSKTSFSGFQLPQTAVRPSARVAKKAPCVASRRTTSRSGATSGPRRLKVVGTRASLLVSSSWHYY